MIQVDFRILLPNSWKKGLRDSKGQGSEKDKIRYVMPESKDTVMLDFSELSGFQAL